MEADVPPAVERLRTAAPGATLTLAAPLCRLWQQHAVASALEAHALGGGAARVEALAPSAVLRFVRSSGGSGGSERGERGEATISSTTCNAAQTPRRVRVYRAWAQRALAAEAVAHAGGVWGHAAALRDLEAALLLSRTDSVVEVYTRAVCDDAPPNQASSSLRRTISDLLHIRRAVVMMTHASGALTTVEHVFEGAGADAWSAEVASGGQSASGFSASEAYTGCNELAGDGPQGETIEAGHALQAVALAAMATESFLTGAPVARDAGAALIHSLPELRSAEGLLSATSRQLVQRMQDAAALRQTLERLKKEVYDAVQRLVVTEPVAVEVATVREQIASLRREIERSGASDDSLQAALKQLKTTEKTAESELIERRRAVQKRDATCQRLKAEQEQAQRELAIAEGDIAALRECLAKNKDALALSEAVHEAVFGDVTVR